MLDNWQVVPYLIGHGGTGKTIVQDVSAAGFSKTKRATITGNNELTFGLDGKYDKYVLYGRDLPRTMSKVLMQEILQSMVSGEDMCVPRKGRSAINVKWTATLLFGSNEMPDYCDTGSQISRRVAPFKFENPVEQDPTVQERIVASELPSLMRQFLEGYLDAVRLHRSKGFWSWCPEGLRASRREVEASTSYVKRFLALTGINEEAATDGGDVVYTERRPEAVTPLQDVQAAYSAFMQRHHKGRGHGERMNRDALIKCGFAVDDHNMCKACGKPAAAGCCPGYSGTNRRKCMVVFGLAIVREGPSDGLSGSDQA